MLIILVSHSKPFALETKKYVLAILPKIDPSLKIEIGSGLERRNLGTDVNQILAIIENSNDNIIIIVDIGSSVMNAKLAIPISSKKNIVIISGPFFEGFLNLVGGYLSKMFLEQALILANQEIEK